MQLWGEEAQAAILAMMRIGMTSVCPHWSSCSAGRHGRLNGFLSTSGALLRSDFFAAVPKIQNDISSPLLEIRAHGEENKLPTPTPTPELAAKAQEHRQLLPTNSDHLSSTSGDAAMG